MRKCHQLLAGFFSLAGLLFFASCSTSINNTTNTVPPKAAGNSLQTAENTTQTPPKVYFIKDITPENLVKIYNALGRDLKGKVAVKISTGEPGGHHFLDPNLIKNLVQQLDGTIVECNTAYKGQRSETENSKKTAEAHGFTAIAPVDIQDEDGSMTLPFPKGEVIKEDYVGTHFPNYNSYLILSHFKGHAMAGFGGALKNMSIGIASAEGKAWIHSGGTSLTDPWHGKQDDFLQAMAEAAGAVMNLLGDNVAYVSVMNHLSIDCDCSSHPAPPELDDIGILASLDPVALDKACVDLIYLSDTQRSQSLRERIESKNGMLTIDHAEKLGLGSQKYELIVLVDVPMRR
ncbi:MAG: DUF362 domain-containing protein [Flavobacteriaceae bacterium]|jgi:uncharacterized Fe-S center protein|nr:DUF362 domain-containing protein [Flavobacteriaceae bacterium]